MSQQEAIDLTNDVQEAMALEPLDVTEVKTQPLPYTFVDLLLHFAAQDAGSVPQDWRMVYDELSRTKSTLTEMVKDRVIPSDTANDRMIRFHRKLNHHRNTGKGLDDPKQSLQWILDEQFTKLPVTPRPIFGAPPAAIPTMPMEMNRTTATFGERAAKLLKGEEPAFSQPSASKRSRGGDESQGTIFAQLMVSEWAANMVRYAQLYPTKDIQQVMKMDLDELDAVVNIDTNKTKLMDKQWLNKKFPIFEYLDM